MIKEALKYIVDLGEAKTMTINGVTHTDKPLSPVYYPLRDTLHTHTLQSLIDYLSTNDGDTFNPQYVHVEDSRNVSILGCSELSCGERRDIFATATAMLPHIQLNTYMPMENFIIQLNTCFDREQGDWEKLLSLASTIQLKDEIKVSDDGISQEVTAKQGVARLANVTIPNPVYLAPIRTFHEVEQVLTPFVYRVDKSGNMGLYEADGGAWQLEAVNRIKCYLADNLTEEPTVTILA